jgi:hypothetical protein
MHCKIDRWFASALVTGLVVGSASLAQTPGPKELSPKVTTQAAPVSVEDIVERIMAFDKNKDGKVTRDELPQRMHHLIELGDTNKDGALDRDEIRKLATKLAATTGELGGGPIRFVPGPSVAGRLKVPADVRFGLFGPPDAIEAVVEDLKLPDKKKDQALAAVKAHQENVYKLMVQARTELLAKMKEVLSEEEFRDFRAALDRPRGETVINLAPRDAPRGGIQRKVEQPPK